MAKNAEDVNNNLEVTINKVGYEIANIIDKNNIEKLLGVLVSDGVYAMWVYMKSKKDIKENELIEKIEPIIKFTHAELSNSDYETYFQKLSEDLNGLLFFREILERALIYARYHAKAMG